MRLFLISVTLCALLAAPWEASAIQSYYLDANAVVSASPIPRVTFTWDAQADGVSINISRRVMGTIGGSATWELRGTVAHPAATFTDPIVGGLVYEYKIYRPGGAGNELASFVSVTLNSPPVHDRGKMLLVVDQTFVTSLATELTQLETDLAGDGWTVQRINFARDGAATPAALKSAIQSAYNADPANTKALYLFGKLPILRSGNIAPDGHAAEPHATDGYYGDMNGTWTDTGTTTNNSPGDGIYDQDRYPSAVELMVGRVNMADMGYYVKEEVELLRDYLNKSHAFRTGQRSELSRTGLFGNTYTSGQHLWQERNWLLPLMGTSNVTLADFQPTLSTTPVLFGMDFGSVDYASYTTVPNKLIFGLNFGSNKQKWWQHDNMMNALLAQPDWGLTCGWGSRPAWFFHHMAAGYPVGYSALRTMNNSNNGGSDIDYYPAGYYVYMTGYVSINLMGDPTLRLDPVAPPRNVTVTKTGASALLAWTASSDSAVSGYHVYRSANRLGPYTCLTSSAAVQGVSFEDTAVPSGDVYYQVRAAKMETHTGSSYSNSSQGAFAKLRADGSANHAPSAQSVSISATANQFSEMPLTGTDSDGDATAPVILTNPGHGRLRWNGNQFLYLPTAGFTGSDSIRYAMSDGLQTSAPETIAITVTPSTNILEWEFGSPASGVAQNMVSTTAAAGMLPSTVGLGAYSQIVTANIFQDDAIALYSIPKGALNSTAYLEWTVAPSTNHEVSMDRLSFGVWNYDPATPVAFQLRWSDDGFVTYQTLPVGSSTQFNYPGKYYAPTAGRPFGVTLSGIPAMQNRTGPVAFRLYYWHPTAVFSSYTGIGKLGTTQPDLVVSGTVTPLSFETWSSEFAWNGKDSSSGGDPDGDRITNRMEFLLGSDPLQPGSAYSQLTSTDDGLGNNYLTLDYRRRTVVDGLTVQTSTNLVGWTDRAVDGSLLIEEIVNANPLGNGTVEDVRLKFRLTPGNSKEFLRLVTP